MKIPKNHNPLRPGKEMPHLQEIPKPGSEEAIEQGCNCVLRAPIFWHLGRWDNIRCSLHNPERRE